MAFAVFVCNGQVGPVQPRFLLAVAGMLDISIGNLVGGDFIDSA